MFIVNIVVNISEPPDASRMILYHFYNARACFVFVRCEYMTTRIIPLLVVVVLWVLRRYDAGRARARAGEVVNMNVRVL